MSKTIEYYNRNASSFAAGTADIDFSAVQDDFLAKLKAGASILDFGCGAGRDARYFLEHVFKVTALDGSAELCGIAEKNTGISVICADFNDFHDVDSYDAIWACWLTTGSEKNRIEPHRKRAIFYGTALETMLVLFFFV